MSEVYNPSLVVAAYGGHHIFRIPFNTCPCRFERRRCPPGTQHSSRHSYFKSKGKYWMFVRSIAGPVFLMLMFMIGCGGAPGNANSNSNAAVNTNPPDLPPGFSTSPVPPSSNTTPGIPPVNASNVDPTAAKPHREFRRLTPSARHPSRAARRHPGYRTPKRFASSSRQLRLPRTMFHQHGPRTA